MQKDKILTIFEKALPIYICPWCNTLGKYNNEICNHWFFNPRIFFFTATCLNCIEEKKNYDDERKNYDYKMTISTVLGEYDIIFNSAIRELCMEKQAANIIRFVNFVNNMNHIRIGRVITQTYENYENHDKKIIPINQYIDTHLPKIIKNIMPNLKLITLCNMIITVFQLPQDLLNVILKMIINIELDGTIMVT